MRMAGLIRARQGALAAALVSLTIGVVALPTLAALPAAGAAFNALGRAGGPTSAARSFRVGDGSEVSILARSIDALGRPRVSVFAPDVPGSYWKTLGETRRLRTQVDAAKAASGAELHVNRGDAPGALARATYLGLPVWSLTRP